MDGLLQAAIIAITVIVVAIPEGLPLSVTLALAYSMKEMLHEQSYVRRLDSCETMGGADMILCDKTGTLTYGVLTLCAWWNEHFEEFDTYS